MIKKQKRDYIFGYLTIFFLIVLDQVTKYLAVYGLKEKNPFVIIDGVFEFHYLENESAAFGLDLITILHKIFNFSYFNNNPDALLTAKMVFFIVITSVVVCFLFYIYSKVPKIPKFIGLDWILILFISGAIGNLIDRCVNNYVIDFFYFKLIDFPIFNVADIYVTVAAGLFIILGLFYYKEEDFELLFPSKKRDT